VPWNTPYILPSHCSLRQYITCTISIFCDLEKVSCTLYLSLCCLNEMLQKGINASMWFLPNYVSGYEVSYVICLIHKQGFYAYSVYCLHQLHDSWRTVQDCREKSQNFLVVRQSVDGIWVEELLIKISNCRCMCILNL
jgi:hypothetical protein